MKRETSPLTKAQWMTLHNAAKSIELALSDFQTKLAQAISPIPSEDPLKKKLLSAFEHLPSATELGVCSSYFFMPQSEWTGGDSSDSKNFVLREPHISGQRRTVLN